MLSLDRYHSEETCTPCSQIPSTKIQADICAVCLEEDSKPDVMLLGCCHTFHSECILTWVQQNFSCPLCRQECQSFVPMNGQALSPQFTEVWENHFIEKAPEPIETTPTKTKINLLKEDAPSTNSNRIATPPLCPVVIEAPISPQVVSEPSPRIEAVDAPIPLLAQAMADMPLIAKSDWFYCPNFTPRVQYSPVLSISSLVLAPTITPTHLTALLFLESLQAVSNSTFRPSVVRVSANQARVAKHSILQGRVAPISISRLHSKRMRLQPLVTAAVPRRTVSQTSAPRFRLASRYHYKTQILHEQFGQRTIARVTNKVQKLSALL